MKINEKNLTGFAVSNSPVDKDGWLLKRGEVNKSFQRRWFALKGNLLFYFEKKTDKEPSGVIILEGCTIELAEYEEQYAFKIVFHGAGDRTYVMGADTQETMEGWMKALACASYDYMKLMVSELQRQLDEIVELEKAHVSIFDEQSQQRQHEQHLQMTSNALQKSGFAGWGRTSGSCAPAANGPGFGMLANVVGTAQCQRSPVMSSSLGHLQQQQQRVNPFNRCQSEEAFEKPSAGGATYSGSAPGTPQHLCRQAATATSFKISEKRQKIVEEVLVKSSPASSVTYRIFADMHEKYGTRISADITRWQVASKNAISIPVGKLINLGLD